MSELKINFDQFTARNIDKPDSETSKALGKVLVQGVDEFVATQIVDPESEIAAALSAAIVGGAGAIIPPSGGDDTAAIQAALTAGKKAIRLDPSATYSVGALSLSTPVAFYGENTTLNMSASITSNGNASVFHGVKAVIAENLNATDGGAITEYVRGGFAVRNDRAASTPVLDVAGFQGQGVGANDTRTVQVHHYNDNDAMWIDNVGSGIGLRINNARNITRRADKPTDYVGAGNYISLHEMKADGSGYLSLLQIDKSANFLWTGAAGSRVGTAKFTQNKGDDATWAFAFDTTHVHTNIMKFGGVAELITDVGKTRANVRSSATMASGLALSTVVGPLTLAPASNQINIATTADIRNADPSDATPVAFARVVKLKLFGTLPTASVAHTGGIAFNGATGKLAYCNGTTWTDVS